MKLQVSFFRLRKSLNIKQKRFCSGLPAHLLLGLRPINSVRGGEKQLKAKKPRIHQPHFLLTNSSCESGHPLTCTWISREQEHSDPNL
jgi:hypothetical protein